jgi:hypothetical protein
LDRSLPFIDVIPNEKLEDLEYISCILAKNRKISITMRKEIREYGIHMFGWHNVLQKYISTLQHLSIQSI